MIENKIAKVWFEAKNLKRGFIGFLLKHEVIIDLLRPDIGKINPLDVLDF